jgi:hypothetical protein
MEMFVISSATRNPIYQTRRFLLPKGRRNDNALLLDMAHDLQNESICQSVALLPLLYRHKDHGDGFYEISSKDVVDIFFDAVDLRFFAVFVDDNQV